MVLARSCALTAVASFLALGLGRKENRVRQQLREWCYEAPAKRGAKRQALEVEPCFAPLLGWVLSWWKGDQLAVAIDATSLGARFVVLAVSVVYRGCAIPVAWTVLAANQKACVAGRMVTDVAPGASRRAAADDGDRLGGSRVVCPLAVPAYRALRLASVLTDQYGGNVSADGHESVPGAADLCPGPREQLAGPGHGLCEQAESVGLYAVGSLGRGV